MSQPEVTIGTAGHIAHGKTSLIYALTGKLTLSHSEELKRGITIKLGYADMEIRKCDKCEKLSTKKKCPFCGGETSLVRKVSFVDSPGHESLMATVAAASSIMDGAMLVIAANEPCPQPQTEEHLKVLKLAGVNNIIVVQNKIDLVSDEQAVENYNQIKDLLARYDVDAPVIPASAHRSSNFDVILQAIEDFIPTPKRDKSKDPIMLTVRSFDVNKPGTDISDLVGGVVGGSIISGEFKVGQKIEIRPGVKEKGFEPIVTEIASLYSGKESLKKASPGGNIAIGTKLDPSLTGNDALAGRVVGLTGKLPPVFSELKLRVESFDRDIDFKPFINNEVVLVNAWTARSAGYVKSFKKDILELSVKPPVCIDPSVKVVLSRKVDGRWRLFGYGVIDESGT
ncbi:MAG TPA: translation initiation factor IF-2 subunit gamma [Candidatus Aenigmarchaeota archaeon]|nr:translation initiation factor IF-2 subunit gamma [Candidatus Aenigmarchaeota archaeon]HEX32942.1 translation initiation factor IF-2 subunit gamma [Candidatus Aenigmarchaeota archaeon]